MVELGKQKVEGNEESQGPRRSYRDKDGGFSMCMWEPVEAKLGGWDAPWRPNSQLHKRGGP